MGDKGTLKALNMLRRMPRVALNNLVEVPGRKSSVKRGRGIYGGKTHGCGFKGLEHHGKHSPVGYEGGQSPFFQRFPLQKWAKERYDISYIPLSLQKLQLLLDTGRLDPSIPIDLTQLGNTGVFKIDARMEHGGFMLEEEGLDCFCSAVNIEVQFASEASIAAVEKAGGAVTTSYYDPYSVTAALRPRDFFKKGLVIPRRQLPPQRHIEYYSDARNRGYLADPDDLPHQRLHLSQKYGYSLPDLSTSPLKDLMSERKDPRQVFYGLEPGWIVNMAEKVIVKPTDPELKEYYAS